MKRAAFLFLIVVIPLGFVTIFVSQWYRAAFPDISPGTYVGVLTFEGSTKKIPWLVVRRAEQQSLSVAVGTVTMAAQQATSIDPLSGAPQALFIGGQDVRFRFTGSLIEEGRYEGDFLNPISQEQGRWFLSKVRISELSSGTEAQLTRWFALWQELEQLEGAIQQVQRTADDHAASIESLHRVVLDDDSLRKSADVRLERTDSETEAAREELRARQQQLDRKLRDFDLTQRVSKSGRLVFLSRETIQRESRWIELSLQLLAPETSVGFDQALERAERVRSLQQAIAKEREEKQMQEGDGRLQRSIPSVASEGDFYEHLR